jgi:hypothetical protein
MKKVLLAFAVASIFAACNNSKSDTNSTTTDSLKIDSSSSPMGADTGRMNNYTDTGRMNNSTDTGRMKNGGTKGTGTSAKSKK